MVRFKQRYILAQVLIAPGEAKIESKDLYSVITSRLQQATGVFGFGLAKGTLTIKYWNPSTGFLLLRVARMFEVPLRMAVAGIKELGTPVSRHCIVHVLKVSGTIRGARLAHLKIQRQMGTAEKR